MRKNYIAGYLTLIISALSGCGGTEPDSTLKAPIGTELTISGDLTPSLNQSIVTWSN